MTGMRCSVWSILLEHILPAQPYQLMPLGENLILPEQNALCPQHERASSNIRKTKHACFD